MSTIAICVGRQLGSAGSSIAKAIAAELNFKYCDSEVINAASVKSGISRKIFEKTDEERSTFKSYLSNLIPFVGTSDFYGNSFDEETLFHFLSMTITDFAKEQSCVFVGRCAEYILRNKPEMLSLFICADKEDRINNLMKRRNITQEAARKLITQNDRKRANFHDFYSTRQWGQADTYDLCINTSRLGEAESLAVIMSFIRKRFSL